MDVKSNLSSIVLKVIRLSPRLEKIKKMIDTVWDLVNSNYV